MATNPSIQDRDIVLGDRDFTRIAALVHEIAGIVLPENKRPLVHSRLIRRLRAMGLSDFATYADVISGPGNEGERSALISAVTTNVTSFFREQHHFQMLTSKILPPLNTRLQSGGRVRIWSAGCSTGEEPYSIAATVLSGHPDAISQNFRILATDIDQSVVAHAQAGLYATEAAKGVPPDMVRRLFDPPGAAGTLRITDALRRMVTCNALNLQGSWPMKGTFDVIFCRNVVIYFDKATQERLWQRFAGLLSPGGYLFIGHSERVTGPALSELEGDGITAYRRR